MVIGEKELARIKIKYMAGEQLTNDEYEIILFSFYANDKRLFEPPEPKEAPAVNEKPSEHDGLWTEFDQLKEEIRRLRELEDSYNEPEEVMAIVFLKLNQLCGN